jgi:hypothetical protein
MALPSAVPPPPAAVSSQEKTKNLLQCGPKTHFPFSQNGQKEIILQLRPKTAGKP